MHFPPETVAPGAGRPRSMPVAASAALHQVIAEPAGVRIRSRADEEVDGDSGIMEEEGSVSSSGTGSSRTRESHAPSSLRSSVPSSSRAHTISTRDSDGSARGVGRSVVGRRHRVVSDGSGRRHRASRMRDLGNAVLDGLGRRSNRSGSEGEVDDDDDELDRRDGTGSFGDADAMQALRAAVSSDRIVRRAESVAALSGGEEADSEMVTVELGVLRKLVHKVEVAERALADMTNDSRDRVTELFKAVSAVSASLSHYDERQQKRFDVLTSVFTGNNDSIERLTCGMLTIRSELRDYEMRRSRRFWRMIGLKVVDLLAYVALFVVWVCASLYNVVVRQKRALGRLVSGDEGDKVTEEKNAIQRHSSFEAARTDSGSFDAVRTDSGDGVRELVGKDFGSIANAADEYESMPSDCDMDGVRGVGGDGVSIGSLG